MTPTSLARSSTVMAAGTVASRALGFVRALAIAAVIGAGLVGDTFVIANVLPNIVYLLLAGGVINSVFVPQLVRAMREDPDGGDAFADRLLTFSLLVLVAITVVMTLAVPLLTAAYATGEWSDEQRHLATSFAYWCMPQVLFYGVYTMLGQVSNARGRFGPMMWAPIANNVVVIGVVALFAVVGSVEATDPGTLSGAEVALLGGGSTLGVVVQALVLLPSLRAAGYRYRPRLGLRGSGLGRAATLATWTLAFVAVNQVAYFVVTKVASNAGAAVQRAATLAGTLPEHAAGNAAYSNAYLFFILPHSVITVSLVTALLPRMSVAAVDGKRSTVRAQVSEGLRTTGVLLVPASVLLVLTGPTLGAALFQGGKLTEADGRYIGILVSVFALGLVPFSAHHVLLRSFYAYEDTRTPFLLACVVAGVNTALAVVVWVAVPTEHATASLAGAYAVAYWAGSAVAARVAGRRLGGRGPVVVRTYVRAGVASLVAALPALGVVLAVPHLSTSRVAQAATVLVAGVVMGVCYLVLARRMRLRELDDVFGSLPGRLGRSAG